MKNYSNLQAIETKLPVLLDLDIIGTPEICVIVGNHFAGGKLFQPVQIACDIDLLQCFTVEIKLQNKIYDCNHETAVIIKTLQIDGIDLVPRFDYLAEYVNDHGNNNPTSYLGFNGKWRLTFDRPFYQWLHQATGQGWLLG